jgi:hypothetical protein
VDAVEKMIDTVEMTDAGKSSISNVDTRSNPWAFVRQVEKGEPLKEWVEEEFYEELWMCPEKGTRIRKSPPTLVWVRRDLVDKRNFTEGDCYLLLDGDTPGPVREMILSGGSWRGGRRPSLLRLERKYAMADWNRCGGRGCGGRGGDGEHPSIQISITPPPLQPVLLPWVWI